MSYLIHNFFRLEIDVLQVKKPPSTIDYSIKYKQTTKTAVDKLNICTQMKAAVCGERAEVCFKWKLHSVTKRAEPLVAGAVPLISIFGTVQPLGNLQLSRWAYTLDCFNVFQQQVFSMCMASTYLGQTRTASMKMKRSSLLKMSRVVFCH